ncbi:MAG: hypothetical protein HC866_13455 [Leptolyngbyaceae cyanobacterium RU_5_1]|nr:hypothetical protein [Leptolyngbyaceae cyanobacterium RU_5_1]
MISSLIAIASFLAVLGGGVAAYWFWQKRTHQQSSSSSQTRVAMPASTKPAVESGQSESVDRIQESLPLAASAPSPTFAELTSPVTLSAVASPPAPAIAIPSPQASTFPQLNQTIAELGRTGQANHVAQLTRYATHRDEAIRIAVASALGGIAAHNSGKGVEHIVPILGKLSQDAKQQVCVSAVEALGKIRSKSVLPWLQRALKHPNASVVKSAYSAIQQLKLNYGFKKPAKTSKRVVQKTDKR